MVGPALCPHSATGCSDGGHWSSRTRRPGQRGALLYPHQQSVIRLVTIQSCEGVYWFVDMMIHHCLPGPWGKVIYYTKRQQDQTWHITVCCVKMWVCWMLVLIPFLRPGWNVNCSSPHLSGCRIHGWRWPSSLSVCHRTTGHWMLVRVSRVGAWHCVRQQ